ncbi:MAG: hypothetical protein RIK85_14735 [Marinobacter sp.]
MHKFHLPFRAPVALTLLLATVILVAAQGSITYFYASFPIIVVSLLSEVFICQIVLSEKGMTYNRNKLEWSEISSLKRTRFLGLPYLKVQRRKGMGWWVPLYYVGKTSFEKTLTSYLPAELANELGHGN